MSKVRRTLSEHVKMYLMACKPEISLTVWQIAEDQLLRSARMIDEPRSPVEVAVKKWGELTDAYYAEKNKDTASRLHAECMEATSDMASAMRGK